eukprot:CAMPEP_0198251356 /NCGR_PEP_ID=MMETSP1447-20131203/2208_1 /TAXON_ID=420782 /ORGANISM="Chaetoceros dichaeta, Strain CCMP1751" /LENGTH=492 /DNA_ID=CAMNT_0043936347 /DNA_START=32 /DNA_END=1510 /DNA_ORIENTATION=+
MTEFPIGTRVILKDLTKGTHFNGQVGIIKSVLTAQGRQLVSLVGNDEGKALGLKPTNLKYEPRAIDSLSIKELKVVLTAKNKDSDVLAAGGIDKSQLLNIVRDTVESEEEVAEILALATVTEQKVNTKKDYDLKNKMQQEYSQVASMSPDAIRSQAQMMKSMDSATIRRMNPAMANFTDAQIKMAADQMEMMSNNPDMFKGMVDQMKNMSGSDLEQVRRMQNGGAPSAEFVNNMAPPSLNPALGGGGGGAPVGDITKQQMETGLNNMANLTPEQLRQQAAMMKSMDPATLRRMNPAMANWSDSQIQMAISQMDMMAGNPDMMKTMTEQVKNMNPEDIKKMQAGTMSPDAANGAPGGMPQDPMQMLQNADPAQIKQMINMVKDNPAMMKDMLRSANPSMGDKISDDQISKTMEMFANLDDKKIERLMKLGSYAQKARELVRGKGVFIIISLAVFCYGVIGYVIKSRGNESKTLDTSSFAQPEPVIPVMDEDEF